MKRITLLTALLLCLLPLQARKEKKFTHETFPLPKVERQVIGIETENTALVLLVHYGAPLGAAAQFLSKDTSSEDYNGARGLTYPATGGRFTGDPALHVKYADGSHNTELYYTGHTVTAGEGFTRTAIGLKDYVTGLEVTLVYDA